MSDCCIELVSSALVPPFELVGKDPNVLVSSEESLSNTADEKRISPAVAPEANAGQQGVLDNAAFARQIENELPFLRKIVRRWHRDQANADDLVQDTVLRALANAHLWQPGSNLRGWLVTIMRNQFLAAAGKSKRSADLMAMMLEQDASAPEPSGAKLMLRDVERGLRRLSAIQRIVLLAVGVDSKSYTEVAHNLGLTVGAVRCHLSRARQRLRAAVGGECETAPLANRSEVRPRVRSLAPKLAVAPRSPTPVVKVSRPFPSSVDVCPGELLGVD